MTAAMMVLDRWSAVPTLEVSLMWVRPCLCCCFFLIMIKHLLTPLAYLSFSDNHSLQPCSTISSMP